MATCLFGGGNGCCGGFWCGRVQCCERDGVDEREKERSVRETVVVVREMELMRERKREL